MGFGDIGKRRQQPRHAKFGGGDSNILERLIYAQKKAELDVAAKKQERGNIAQDIQTVKSQFGGNIPPGATLNVGDVNAPLNRELTGEERQEIAGARSLEPSLRNIQSMISKGILKPRISGPIGNVERTAKQSAIDFGEPLATSFSPELQTLQSEFNTIKSQLPFIAGGKQLTGTEKALVFKLLNTRGKSDEIIINDLDKAFRIILEKEKLAIGGQNAAKIPIGGMNSPEIQNQDNISNQRISRLTSIKERYKQRNP